MRITIAPTDKTDKCGHPTVSVSLPGDDHALDVVWDNLVKPALVGAGFLLASIEEVIEGKQNVE